MKASASSDNLACVHGVRVLSTFWVIMGHTWLIGIYLCSLNSTKILGQGKKWWFQGLSNASVSVDTFLLISGLLVAFLLSKELDKKKGKVNFALLYVHRYLRLTPVYALLLAFFATLFVHMGTGPNWIAVVSDAQGCRQQWWRHLLYINNLFSVETSGDVGNCMEHTWYMAVDTQLFILAPIFVYLLWRNKKVGQVVLLVFLVASLSATFAIYAVYELMPTIMFTRIIDTLNMGTDFSVYYNKPWTRAPPYLIGIWVGWFLYLTRNSQRRIPKFLVAALWAASLAIIGAVIYGLVSYVDQADPLEPGVKLAYGPLHRPAWGLAVSWVVFACVQGYGGFVNRFLSWKGFQPLSRLTYVAYLFHYDYLNAYAASNRRQMYYTIRESITIYFGVLVTVFAIAFVVSATIEASFLNLEKLLFVPINKTNDANKSNANIASIPRINTKRAPSVVSGPTVDND